MGKRSPRRQSPVHSPAQTTQPTQPTSANQARRKSSLFKLGAIGVAGALLVIAIAVVLTPLPDDEITDVAGLAEEQPNNSAAESTSVSPESATSTLKLPTVRKTINAEQLQAELSGFGDRLQSKYPADADQFQIAAQIFTGLKQTGKAEQAWKKCLQYAPSNRAALFGLSEIWIKVGRNQEALDLLQKASAEIGPNADLLLRIGECQENLGEIEAAERSLQQSVELDPQLGVAWQALGRMQNQLGKLAEAESSLRKAIELNGPSEPALQALITSLVRQKRTDEATELRKQLVSLLPTPATNDSFQSTYDAALSAIAVKAYLAAAQSEESKRNPQEAATYALKALEFAPNYLDAYLTLASIYRAAGNLADLAAIHRRIIELQPNNAVNYLNLANVLLQLGDASGAELRLRQAIELEPQAPLAQIALARLCLSTNRSAEAHLIALNLSKNHQSIEAIELLIATYEATGDQKSADALAAKVKSMQPTKP